MGTGQSRAEQQAMRQALDLARRGRPGLNPLVGCVVLDDAGRFAGAGWHRGVGSPHAEVVALAEAGERARGGSAVVTLEPCAHVGRTGPCARAVIEAGVSRVVYGQPDPNPVAAGGSDRLRVAGVVVEQVADPALRQAAEDLLRPWAVAHRFGRPLVTWKYAATLDGRSAAADGTSRWITGAAARADVHLRRAACDAVLVGTGTVLADDPWLVVRDVAGRPVGPQPLRAVMGVRDLPAASRVLDGAAETVLLRTRDPHDALRRLWQRGRRHVWLEGGPRLAAAFVAARLVDDVVAYLAPALLGGGASALADVGVTTIAGALRLRLLDVAVLDGDVRLRAQAIPQHQ